LSLFSGLIIFYILLIFCQIFEKKTPYVSLCSDDVRGQADVTSKI